MLALQPYLRQQRCAVFFHRSHESPFTQTWVAQRCGRCFLFHRRTESRPSLRPPAAASRLGVCEAAAPWRRTGPPAARGNASSAGPSSASPSAGASGGRGAAATMSGQTLPKTCRDGGRLLMHLESKQCHSSFPRKKWTLLRIRTLTQGQNRLGWSQGISPRRSTRTVLTCLPEQFSPMDMCLTRSHTWKISLMDCRRTIGFWTEWGHRPRTLHQNLAPVQLQDSGHYLHLKVCPAWRQMWMWIRRPVSVPWDKLGAWRPYWWLDAETCFAHVVLRTCFGPCTLQMEQEQHFSCRGLARRGLGI